jgi:hypothetical protein
MVDMPEIRCQRDHAEHYRKVVTVDLSKPHKYHDYPQVPAHLACRFPLAIWTWEHQDYEEVGLYCPAHDAVSRTIDELGIWEPAETILTLSILSHADPDSLFVDMGSQIGWFCALACQARRDAIAFEADPECMALIRWNMKLNDWDDHVAYRLERISPLTQAMPPGRRIALAKIDVEGAEDDAVRVLQPSIDAGLVDHLLLEASPCFADYYGDLIVSLVDGGYDLFEMPEKSLPPARFEEFPRDLEPTRLAGPLADLRAEVNSWHQKNVLLSRKGAW